MTQNQNLDILLKHLLKVNSNTDWTAFQKNKSIFELFTLILEEATVAERLNFTTLFSRLAYVGAKYNLSRETLHYCHTFRKANERGLIRKETEGDFTNLGFYVCCRLLFEVWKVAFPQELTTLSDQIAIKFKKVKEKIIGFRSVVEAVLFEIDGETKTLAFYDEDDPDAEKKALYDVHDKNELFNQNIDSLRKTFTLPVHINLIDVDIRDDGTYIPAAIIISPDHMVDVTAISECFKDFGTEPFLYLISKFKPAEATAPLLTGNLVNIMLDQLVSDPATEFNTLLPTLFKAHPLGFAMMDDKEVVEVIEKLRNHFCNLQFAVNREFIKFEIVRENIFLEPSFYSRDYGIQGRLDLLHQKKDKPYYDIIELKSGKTFRPNVYGINASHYIQTLLYDLMIRSTFQTRSKSFNYILYSRENEKPLRFAPPVRAQQYEAMKLRNDLMAMEQKLRRSDIDNSILTYIKVDNFPRLKGFNSKDIENFYNIYTTLNQEEKSYFDHYTAFIAREQSMAKTGEHGTNKSNGHAAMWLESDVEKRERFSLLSGLLIIDNQSASDDAYITFSRNDKEFTLVNFRIGDIAVLYLDTDDHIRPVLRNQIFKCTITGLASQSVEVRLRNKQYNQRIFRENKYWRLEQDNLDSGFNAMYKSLFSWAAAPMEYRQLFMGTREPRHLAVETKQPFDEQLTQEQTNLLRKMINCKDYFLLWGPPGTGKTSIMLKNLVKHLYEHTSENILLLAYTNRAVDEICDAILNIDDTYKEKYLRVGSRLSTHERYTAQLLDQILKQAKSRAEVLTLLAEKRIYISTVSSIIGKTELFQLKEFDTVIIDEASQILEPMLAGLLCKFKRWILIGDHKQLPAVVVQNIAEGNIRNQGLNDLGFINTRTSLFERLYLHLKKNNWHQAFGILSQQGRMHQELMYFPNQNFYENELELIPGSSRQAKPLFFEKNSVSSAYLQKRKVFINTPEDEDVNWKTNMHEALKCVEVLKDLLVLFTENNKLLHAESIGIITPYRAQIAMIRKCMEVLPFDIAEKISVDTVERYQGGARDIIIISFCVNRLSQLESLISLSQEGIDRKLNVALTRAKEQVIIIGNRDLLCGDAGYKKLISHYDD